MSGWRRRRSVTGTYRYLDDIAIADCAIDLTATSPSELFETAARALAETMVDPSTVTVEVTRLVSLEAPSLDLLLFDWLSDLICRKDEHAEVFIRTQVLVSGDGPYRLEACLHGGPIVPGRTGRRADPKGITLHRFVLEPCPGGWHACFVVDL
jgi:SHS2 domain-containing protein